jgi:hypothetical protein
VSRRAFALCSCASGLARSFGRGNTGDAGRAALLAGRVVAGGSRDRPQDSSGETERAPAERYLPLARYVSWDRLCRRRSRVHGGSRPLQRQCKVGSGTRRGRQRGRVLVNGGCQKKSTLGCRVVAMRGARRGSSKRRCCGPEEAAGGMPKNSNSPPDRALAGLLLDEGAGDCGRGAMFCGAGRDGAEAGCLGVAGSAERG